MSVSARARAVLLCAKKDEEKFFLKLPLFFFWASDIFYTKENTTKLLYEKRKDNYKYVLVLTSTRNNFKSCSCSCSCSCSSSF